MRLGDASPAGRLRLDALARYLQDVSNDDTRDGGMSDERRLGRAPQCVLDVERFPVMGEELVLRTFCGGTGPRWAERRVSVEGDRGGAVEAATLWVHVDLGRAGRRRCPTVHGALRRGGRRAHGAGPAAPRRPARRARRPSPWPLRATDFDVLGHVNNAAYWAPVEECSPTGATCGRRCAPRWSSAPGWSRATRWRCVTLDGEDGGLALWLTDGQLMSASAVVRPWP